MSPADVPHSPALAALLEGSFDALVLRDVEGTILSWSRAAERIYGYSAAEAAGQSMDMLVPGHVREEYERNRTRVHSGEVVAPFETVRRRKGGAFINVLVTLIPVRDENGDVAAVWSMSRDINAEKAAARALAEREHQLQEIAENFPGLIFRRVSWPDGRVEYPYVSNSIERYLGIPLRWPGTVRNPDNLIAHVDEEDVRRWQAGLAEASARMTPLDIEARVTGVDGQMRWVRSISRPQRRADGSLVWDGVVLDITDRKQAEIEARERSALLETIMDTVPAMVWLAHDPEATRVTGSRYAADYLRVSPQSNQSLSPANEDRPLGFRFLKGGEELAPQELPLGRAARGDEIREEELEVVFADGTSRWELVNASPVRDAEGNPIGAVGAGIDITERKRNEERLSAMISELNHRVKNTLASLGAIVRQTQAGAASVQEFAQSFQGRLQAMATAHDQLAGTAWDHADLEQLARDVLAPFAEPRTHRLTIAGPHIELRPGVAVSIGLILHELATNAAKYGAWSARAGAVDLRWAYPKDDSGMLQLTWSEKDGPPAQEPARRGFGLRYVQQSTSYELRGTCTPEFSAAGFRCDFKLPAEMIVWRPPGDREG